MKKKTIAALAVLLLSVCLAACASAVEIKVPGSVRPFDDNVITVYSEIGGKLTIEAVSGTIPLENAVTDLEIPEGTTRIPWEALTFGGEPIAKGRLTLRAKLVCPDGMPEEAEAVTGVGDPKPAVVCCLPGAKEYYPVEGDSLRIEVGICGFASCEVTIAPKDRPGEIVWSERKSGNGKEPLVFRWTARNGKEPCAPGEYLISACYTGRRDRVYTATVTILPEPLPEAKLEVTGSLIPENLDDDAAVWAALTAPVAVGDGGEGEGLRIMNAENRRIVEGTVSCRTTGVAVLEICDDGWVKVGGWRQVDNAYVEGYVLADKLRIIRPNTSYGAVLDKKAQTLAIYEDGKKIGTIQVSTGLVVDAAKAETRSGVFLLGTRMSNFQRDGHLYCYPIRIDGSHLIHQVGYARTSNGRDFDAEIAVLGQKASHGCVRIDPRSTEENNGMNCWWVWTHMGHDCKIIVTDDQ